MIQNIDSFSSDSIIIAATNHPKLLDSAVWRRFDTKLELNIPNQDVRKKIIEHFSNIMDNSFKTDSKKMNQLVKATANLSPDAIKSIFNIAARNCILQEKDRLLYSQVVLEIFVYITPENFTEKDAIKFMVNNLVSQREISQRLSISLRKVRSVYKEIKSNE